MFFPIPSMDNVLWCRIFRMLQNKYPSACLGLFWLYLVCLGLSWFVLVCLVFSWFWCNYLHTSREVFLYLSKNGWKYPFTNKIRRKNYLISYNFFYLQRTTFNRKCLLSQTFPATYHTITMCSRNVYPNPGWSYIRLQDPSKIQNPQWWWF